MRFGRIMVLGACMAALSFSLVACGGDDEGVVDSLTEQAGDATEGAGNAVESVGNAVDDAVADDEVTVRLQAQNNSGITGEAKLSTEDGQTKVTFDLQNAAGPHPAHIHEGTCAKLTAAPKFPLTDVTDGKSETMVAVTLADIQSTPHAINLHTSAQNLEQYVACADIPTRGASSGTTTSGSTTTP